MEDKKRKTQVSTVINDSKYSNDSNDLNDCELKNCGKWEWPYKTMECKCLKVVDGDTITIGFIDNNKKIKINVRFSGLNAAEIHSKDPKELEKAIKVKTWLQDLILNKIIKVEFQSKLDVWGRPLGTIFFKDENINQKMLDLDFVKPYTGSGKKNW